MCSVWGGVGERVPSVLLKPDLIPVLHNHFLCFLPFNPPEPAGPPRAQDEAPPPWKCFLPVGTASGVNFGRTAVQSLLVTKFQYLILGESKVLIYFVVALTVGKIWKRGV